MRFGGAVTDAYGNVRVAFHAHGSITRHDFGLTYELLKEAGGLLVGRDVAIDIDAEAIRASVSVPGHRPGITSHLRLGKKTLMAEDQVTANLKGMDDLDFIGWNNADWNGVFAHHHTDDVLVDWKGQAPTHGIEEHIDAMKAYVESAGGTPPQITSHPIAFGSGEWTCVIGEFEGGGRMVTVAKWLDGAIAEEYIWS